MKAKGERMSAIKYLLHVISFNFHIKIFLTRNFHHYREKIVLFLMSLDYYYLFNTQWHSKTAITRI